MKLSAVLFCLTLCASAALADTLTGEVLEEHCGLKHTALKPDDLACIQKCVREGSWAVLAVGNKVYEIENQGAVTGHIGHRVTVTGRVNGDVVHIDSLKM